MRARCFGACWLEAVRLLIALLFCVVFLGCSGQREDRDVQRPGGVLEHRRVKPMAKKVSGVMRVSGIWAGDPSLRTYLEEQVRLFNFEHPAIDVELHYEGVSDAEEVARLVNRIKNGIIQHDVIRMSPAIYRAVAEEVDDPDWGRKYLVDFGQDEAFVAAHQEAALLAARGSGEMGGILPGPILDGVYEGVWYNRVLGERLGIKIEGPALSYLQLLDALVTLKDRALKTRGKPVVLLHWGGGDMGARLKLFQMLYLSGFVDSEGMLSLLEPPLKEVRDGVLRRTLRAFRELQDHQVIFSRPGESPMDEFLDGRSLFFLENTAAYSDLHARGGDEFVEQLALLEMVSFGPINYACGNYKMSWAVMRRSAFEAESKSFIHHMMRPEVAAGIMQRSQNPCGLKEHNYDPVYALDLLGSYRVGMGKKQCKRLLELDRMVQWYLGAEEAPSWAVLSKTLDRLCRSEIDVDQAFELLSQMRE
jgi:ABC-type glycerol-3-phosphate transport system substrate-binding protein